MLMLILQTSELRLLNAMSIIEKEDFTMMDAKEAIKVLANDMTTTEREFEGRLIKGMAEVISNIIDYQYADIHYNGENRVADLLERSKQIKNSIGIMLGDLQVYMERMGITNMAWGKATSRLVNMAERKVCEK